MPRFGDIYSAYLHGDRHVQGGERPVIISQNDIGNKYSPTVEIIPMSSQIEKAKHLPTHVVIKNSRLNGLKRDSVVLAEQPMTINKEDLKCYIGKLSHTDIEKVGKARKIQSPF